MQSYRTRPFHIIDGLHIECTLDVTTVLVWQSGRARWEAPRLCKFLGNCTDACNQIVKLCQHCWAEKNIPSTWRRADVVLQLKMGDTALPTNYRPISLLAVGYKILASILHSRLLAGVSESRMRVSQWISPEAWGHRCTDGCKTHD